MGGQSNVYVYKKMVSFSVLKLFTRGGLVVNLGQNSVYVVIELPLSKNDEVMTKIILESVQNTFLPSR